MLFSLSGQVRSGLLNFCRTFGPATSFRAAGNSGSALWNTGPQELKQDSVADVSKRSVSLVIKDHIPADYLNGNLRVKGLSPCCMRQFGRVC